MVWIHCWDPAEYKDVATMIWPLQAGSASYRINVPDAAERRHRARPAPLPRWPGAPVARDGVSPRADYPDVVLAAVKDAARR